MIRLAIADDHEMFREMLRLALPRESDVEIVGEAADGKELIQVVDRVQPDVVLLDYKMPFASDFTALVQQVRALQGNPEVIVLSGIASVEVASRAAEGGASGYVLKSTRLSILADAVRVVANGGAWIDSQLDRRAFDIFRRSMQPAEGEEEKGATLLTEREQEVLGCVAQGITNSKIALRLHLSEHTVKTHVTHILEKLQVNNRLAAALTFYGKKGAPDKQLSSIAS